MTYQPYLPATDMERFVRELAEFVTFGDADAAVVRETAPIVLAREEALTKALYEHFLKFPASARFFLKDDGTPDPERIERRRHSLARWLRETAEAALTHENAYYLLTIGLSHIIMPRRQTARKMAPYECGVEPVGSARNRFHVKFYLVAVLFILFDIEAVFLYPWAVAFRRLGLYGLVEMLLFIGILLIGYVYVLKKRALEWE